MLDSVWLDLTKLGTENLKMKYVLFPVTWKDDIVPPWFVPHLLLLKVIVQNEGGRPLWVAGVLDPLGLPQRLPLTRPSGKKQSWHTKANVSPHHERCNTRFKEDKSLRNNPLSLTHGENDFQSLCKHDMNLLYYIACAHRAVHMDYKGIFLFLSISSLCECECSQGPFSSLSAPHGFQDSGSLVSPPPSGRPPASRGDRAANGGSTVGILTPGGREWLRGRTEAWAFPQPSLTNVQWIKIWERRKMERPCLRLTEDHLTLLYKPHH